jgi:hypothetical protein
MNVKVVGIWVTFIHGYFFQMLDQLHPWIQPIMDQKYTGKITHAPNMYRLFFFPFIIHQTIVYIFYTVLGMISNL